MGSGLRIAILSRRYWLVGEDGQEQEAGANQWLGYELLLAVGTERRNPAW